MNTGIYIDKWIIDLLAVDEKAFRVAVFLVCNVAADGKTRTTYGEIAIGTGMTYDAARRAIERNTYANHYANHFPIIRQSHCLVFTIYSEEMQERANTPITTPIDANHYANHTPITTSDAEAAPTAPFIAQQENIALDSLNNTKHNIALSEPKTTKRDKENNPPAPKGARAPLKEKSSLESQKDEAEETAEAPKIKRFVKPTPEQVQAYCDERNNGIDGHDFWDFYESKGWVVGRSPMKDWKAAVRTWERSQKKEQASKPSTIDQYNRGMEIARKLESGELKINIFGTHN